ncbi:unnamed protein product [Durusdinium trenchii]|uniref:Uncharacterized protein n=1 Tax=Durusdinium trenchii TaxID=1381693 RepID=A0ABP0JFW4_9DINO
MIGPSIQFPIGHGDGSGLRTSIRRLIAASRRPEAVSNAGGIGTLGGVTFEVQGFRKEIQEVKRRLNPGRPFGVDLLIPKLGGTARATNKDYTHGALPEMVDIMIQEGPQDAAVRRALRSLGFTEWKLRSLLKSKTWMETGARGVHWSEEDRCAVTEINFPHEGHQEDLRGPLSFRELPELQRLDLRNTHITGDLSELPCKLKHLYLQNTEVTGNLSSLGNMTRMKRLDLSHTTISGDLEHLRPLRQLRTLRLSDTLVTGDLQSLQASQLQVLALEDTRSMVI